MTSSSRPSPELVRVRPARAGERVAVPGRRSPLASAGETVPLTTYWRRRLEDGDVVTADQDVQAPAQTDTVEPTPEPH